MRTRRLRGEVESIDTSSSSGSSTVSYNVTAAFTGDITGIYTDMTGNVTFISRQVTDVLYVSNKAVQSDGTTSYVKVKGCGRNDPHGGCGDGIFRRGQRGNHVRAHGR